MKKDIDNKESENEAPAGGSQTRDKILERMLKSPPRPKVKKARQKAGFVVSVS